MCANKIIIELGTDHFAPANQKVREALAQADVIELNNVLAQRYLGSAMPAGKRLEIHGVPGNDMACYMDGGEIEVYGNAQDQIGNTMNDGHIVIHGRCGDATGYGMRGGKIFVRDGCGWRVGIHMKQYQDKCPTIVIGGDAGSFLGEYMAGGIIVLMGTSGEYLATGMHGGVIYLKNALAEEDVPAGMQYGPVEGEDLETLHDLLKEYNQHFAEELPAPVDESGKGYYCLRPESSRPYASMYA
ncbi:MAG: glutamate synthase [Coriobacteriia bacterium]|nr:glutamate synthase [Coriobacteriia bacterium]